MKIKQAKSRGLTKKKKKKKEARRPGRVRVKKGVYAKLG